MRVLRNFVVGARSRRHERTEMSIPMGTMAEARSKDTAADSSERGEVRHE